MTTKAGSGVIQRYFAFLDRRHLRYKNVGIALSGGPDSTALAICAAEAHNANRLKPILIHINHGVRPNSDDD